MKRLIIIFFSLSLIMFSIAIIIASRGPIYSNDTETTNDNDDNAQITGSDTARTVNVLYNGEVLELSMRDYLIGVTAAEMPASFEPEALKAQAVAARTYTLYKMQNPDPKHPDADVCTDPNCCKAYFSGSELQTRWRDSYDAYHKKIEDAVIETDGTYIIYDGEPILAAFHSSSSGQTENCYAVWGGELPYLVSVASPETADKVEELKSNVIVPYDEFKTKITENFPNSDLSGDINSWVGELTFTDSGRVDTINIGGVEIPAKDLRSIFGLRSTDLTITTVEQGISITTSGYGHGVGMSQYGANILALQGKDFVDILKWYYTGVEVIQSLA